MPYVLPAKKHTMLLIFRLKSDKILSTQHFLTEGIYMLRDLIPTDNISGFDVRPGYFDKDGATPVRGGICFTVSSVYATSCTLLLFKPGARRPKAKLRFPDTIV